MDIIITIDKKPFKAAFGKTRVWQTKQNKNQIKSNNKNECKARTENNSITSSFASLG